jgi:hypothetical protein
MVKLTAKTKSRPKPTSRKRKPRKPKGPTRADINHFISWIYAIDAADYRGQTQIINQMQSYKRTSRITTVLNLYALWIQEGKPSEK